MRTRKSVNDAYDIFGNPTLMDRHHDIHSYLIPDEERKWWRWFHVRNRGYSIFVHLWKNSKDGICKTVSYTELQQEFSLARSRVAIEVKKLEHLGVIEKLKTGIAYNRSVYKVLSPKEARELVDKTRRSCPCRSNIDLNTSSSNLNATILSLQILFCLIS
jgi:DNA-binding MarR family transcriptional regulator